MTQTANQRSRAQSFAFEHARWLQEDTWSYTLKELLEAAGAKRVGHQFVFEDGSRLIPQMGMTSGSIEATPAPQNKSMEAAMNDAWNEQADFVERFSNKIYDGMSAFIRQFRLTASERLYLKSYRKEPSLDFPVVVSRQAPTSSPSASSKTSGDRGEALLPDRSQENQRITQAAFDDLVAEIKGRSRHGCPDHEGGVEVDRIFIESEQQRADRPHERQR